MIIGVAGCYASGKGEAVAFLESRGFCALSLSDVLREELAARGMAETRESMIETGNALRAAEGPAVLAHRLLRRCAPDRNYIVDSFMVVVTGGVGKLAGTTTAALGIGTLNKVLEPSFGAVYGKVTILILIILFLRYRPSGLYAPKGRRLDS